MDDLPGAVLFACSENSIRSPMAEGLLKHLLGHRVYVASSESGLSILDVSDPESPFEVGYYDTPRSARRVFVTGPYAYVGDLEWLRVFDVSRPSAPREIASYKTPSYARDVWVANGTAYVAAYNAGLMILRLKSQ